ncbi:TMEM165/GDT1 family protein [Myxacorys almedinensis]|uniref:GDT1 family protein n=1 Tax=Myxacorys almedinensis A TaxID=2690445 RepID=A0A8J7Z5W2_9CYAN|nr:TMEM165/GDT1 family protein [Myxacorys almedinensis]NDJ18461.1 TMEM165/GDT1 family protein [Myxacorys almedinensis A]
MTMTPLPSPNSLETHEPSLLIVSEQPLNVSTLSAKGHFLSAFGSTFVTIFLAELGDKTQVATLLMSAQSHAPWIVFAGAASALVSTSLIGVIIGRWLCQNLSPRTLEKATGCLLLVISMLLVLDIVRM